MDAKIKKLEESDLEEFIALIAIFENVFEMKNFVIPAKTHLKDLLAKPDFFVWVAIIEDRIIGGLTGYVLQQYYSPKPLAYIYDLAVATSLQRKGIGKQLIKDFTEYYKNKGFEEVFVQADKIDDYAIDFYRSTGVTNEEDVIHFYYTLN